MPRKIGTENWRKKRRQEHLEMKEYRYVIPKPYNLHIVSLTCIKG